jgi:hypothetical protein
MNISNLMKNYFNEESQYMLNENLNIQNKSIPIVVSKSKWNIESNIMSRIYEFSEKDKSVYFMQQIMQYISNSEHNIEVRFKKEKCIVIIRALASFINEYELEACKYFDKIYNDTNYIKLKYDYEDEF